VWDDYCDWYLELIKPEFGKQMDRETAERALIHFEALLTAAPVHALHHRRDLAAAARTHPFGCSDREFMAGGMDGAHITRLRKAVWHHSAVDFLRPQYPIGNECARSAGGGCHDQTGSSAEMQEVLTAHRAIFEKMLRMNSFTRGHAAAERPKASASDVVSGHQLFVPLSGLIDFEKEKERVRKEISRLESFLISVEKKLSNEQFLANAPEQVVQNERNKQADARINLDKMRTILADLEG
jgi:valyl-tRNA synthetase